MRSGSSAATLVSRGFIRCVQIFRARRISLGRRGDKVGNPLAFGGDATSKAAQVATRLTRFPAQVQNLVMKAGYAQADAALRSSGLPGLPDSAPSFASLPLLG